MQRMTCRGLDGRNPLHLLAALGALRLGTRLVPGLQMGWVFERGTPWPVFAPVADPEGLIERMASWLRKLGEEKVSNPEDKRRLSDQKARKKKLEEQIKEERRRAKQEARRRRLTKGEAESLVSERVRDLESQLQSLSVEVEELQRRNAGNLGDGIAHLGSYITGPSDVIREFGERAIADWLETGGRISPEDAPSPHDPWLRVSQLPGLANELNVEKGILRPTPFSFSNGASRQELLKDFRNLTTHVTLERLRATLLWGEARFVEGLTSLNWDPRDLRPHALMAQDPSNLPKTVDVGANVLAYLGLSFLVVIPTSDGSRVLGYQDRESGGEGFVWPLWEAPLPLDVVAAMFAQDWSREGVHLARRGIREVRESMILREGNRTFFSPSRVLVRA